MEHRIVLVLLAAMCCLCEVRAAQVAVAHTLCTDGAGGINGACGSATAHSSSTGTVGIGPVTAHQSSSSSIRNVGSATAHSSSIGPDGITRGECAYTNPQGKSIKIKYQQLVNGEINAEADDSVVDPLVELDRCREAIKASNFVAQQNFEQIQAQHQQLQEQIQRQQQQLQEEIFRQQQAIFNPRNFPLPVGFNPIQFPNFHQGGFGPQF